MDSSPSPLSSLDPPPSPAEILITAGGENVAPVPIEDRIKVAAPFLGNVMLIGDKRKFITCLVTIQVSHLQTKRAVALQKYAWLKIHIM